MGKRGPQPGSKPRVTDGLDIDEVCQRISDGDYLDTIAKDNGIRIGTLLAWLDETPDKSARARAARQATAKYWEEKAASGIADAKDGFELSKAKELAHHYRWRASKIAPKEYGDKVALTGEDGGPIEQLVKHEVTWKKPDEG